MLKNKKSIGFTLSELITAMGIIGILAGMTIPAVIENLHKRSYCAQLKSIIGEIQQLASVQMATKGTKDLSLTDFSNAKKLFSDKNFVITKKCSSADALAECWNVSTTKKYKYIGGGNHKNPPALTTIVLKSGAIISYKPNTDTMTTFAGTNDTGYGTFYVDLNGQDKPNIVGRDRFGFYLSRQGHIYGSLTPGSSTVAGCKSSTGQFDCTDLVITSGWEMDY